MTVFHKIAAGSVVLTLVFALATSLASATPADKLPELKSPIILGDVDGETFDQMSIINIRFSTNPSWETLPKVEDHGMFLQITLPDTIVTEPGKFYEGAAPNLPKIAVIQATSKDAAVRVFTTKPANLVREASKTELLGNRLMVTLDHKKLEELMATSPATVDTSFVGPPVPQVKNATSAEEVISATNVRSDLPAPSLVLKKEPATAVGIGTANLDLRGKMVKAGIFCAFMFLVLIASWVAKPYIRKKRGLPAKSTKNSKESSALAFETIATMALSPRQKIMVVQIGNDRVMLGVGPDSINFLTNLSTNDTPQQSQAHAAKMLASNSRTSFEESLNEDKPMNLVPKPVLKNIEGNDPETLRQPMQRRVHSEIPSETMQESQPMPRQRPLQTQVQNSTNNKGRLNIRIDDNGATNLSRKKAPEEKKQAIDDITSIIREKLNTLRTI